MKKKIFTSVFLTLFIVAALLSCHFAATLQEEPQVELTFDSNSARLAIGEMDIVNLKTSGDQNRASIRWEYDSSIISAKTDNYAAIITGLKPGKTTLKAISGSNSVTCLVNVSDESYTVTVTNPYVYANTDYMEIEPNQTQKISASLFGGNPSDINGFTWSIDKPSIASLSVEGNYCWVTGVSDGIAKITVKHNKAPYGYSVLVNCTSDGSTMTYITTAENIITINKSESNTAEFAVDLVNSPLTDYASGFTYTVVDELGQTVQDSLIISGAGSLSVSITAYEVGNYYVRCSHPDAVYTLDVLVRVLENVETAYIEPSMNLVTLSGQESQMVSLSLMNFTGVVDSNLFTWKFSSNAESYISYELFNGSETNTGDTIMLKGKKTGSCKITVSYPNVPDRNIIVLIRDLQGESASAKTYITTSQNYIKLGLNDEPTNISITLTESKGADINDLNWSIVNSAADGSSNDVIEWVVGTGSHTSSSQNSRAAVIEENALAYATIRPVNTGVAYIDISHPKAIYKTRITVTVTENSQQASSQSVLSLLSSPVINIVNGQTSTVLVGFTGNGNASEIEWSSSNDAIKLTPNGTDCVIVAPAALAGVTKATVTASHKNAEYPVTFSVLCYDTQEELEANKIKAMYSLNTNADIVVNNKVDFSLTTEGFDENQSISWTVTKGDDLITYETTNNNKVVTVTGNAAGQSILKASSDGCNDVYFIVNIKDINIIDADETCYLSTYTNVLYFSNVNESQQLEITAFNLDEISYSNINFSCDSNAFEIASNGNIATVTALEQNSKATLTVTHPLSENTLTIYLHCGEQYEYVNEDYCYISTEKDTLELYVGQDEVQLVATLNHTEESDNQQIVKGFTFASDNQDVATVSYTTYSNFCFVKPNKSGTAKITITHPDSDFEKEVIVVVKHAPDADTIPYLTTKTNVITIIQGEYATATVDLLNSTSIDSSKWTWETADSRTCDIVANNGTSSMLSANKPGTTEITVKHKDCIYSLKLIVVVLDASVVTSRPYIKSSDNIITIRKGTSATISAEMIGSTNTSDKNYFKFNGSNSSIIMVNGTSDSAYIKGLNTGMAYVTISNARYSDSYSKTVLVIVEDTQVDGVYIKPSTNIIKIKPDERSLINITAQLVGGEATDGENFIWWTDDPNLIGITSVADQCAITPTGRSGTTKIHIKHEKALQVCDILVMISDYDTFAFDQTSLKVSSEKLYFIPMQIPALEEEFTVEYSSTDENVCIVQGSNSVAWICGRDYGNASLTAKMVSKDGVELASTEMLVNVTVPDINLPTISLGNSIITVEAGTSRTFSAIITGETVEESEKYNLKWSWKSGTGDSIDGLSILNETPDKVAYGADAYVTFNEAGEYVLYVTHEASGVVTSMYVIVEEKGEIGIELNTNLETIYKDDGSISLTATLTNAAEQDYRNIEWSAIKVGGQSIVSVSKTKGKTCTVTPKNVGQTTVVAKLPSGKTATCIVIVKASTQLMIDLGSIHIIPGYTEVVNYTTIPENATVNWITQMTSSGNMMDNSTYFRIEDDTAKRQLRITGLKDCPGGAAGTITGYIFGASSGTMPKINVYVEYDLQLSLSDMSGNFLTRINNNNPDTANEMQFKIKYYPIDSDIDIIADGKILACIPYESNTLNHSADNSNPLFSIGDTKREVITEDGIKKGLMTVSIIPHAEGSSTIDVRATLPSDSSGTYTETQSFLYTAYYDEYDIEIDWEKLTPVGSFTHYDENKNTLYIGDGEEAVFTLNIKNENASGRILEDRTFWVPAEGNEPDKIKEMQLATNSQVYDKNKKRLDKANVIFGAGNIKNQPQNVVKNNLSAQTGLIHFETENNVDQTVFRLSHNWDYYKDLPDEVTGANWENYKQANMFRSDFITSLKAKGVDHWLFTENLYINDNGTRYYAVPQGELPLMTGGWSIPTKFTYRHTLDQDDNGEAQNYFDVFVFCFPLLTANNQRLMEIGFTGTGMYFEWMIDGAHGKRGGIIDKWLYPYDAAPPISPLPTDGRYPYDYILEAKQYMWGVIGTINYTLDKKMPNVITKFRYNINVEPCTHFVITTEELNSNYFLVVPEMNRYIRYLRIFLDNISFTNGDQIVMEKFGIYGGTKRLEGDYYDFDYSEYPLRTLNCTTPKVIYEGMTPTISKDTTVKGTARGTLNIAYRTGSSNEVKYIPLTVEIQRRDCEAYTKNEWVKTRESNGYNHWTLQE